MRDEMMKFSEKTLFTLIIMAFVSLLFYLTANLSPVARLVPLTVLIPTLGLLTLQLVLDLVPGLEGIYRRFEKVDLFGLEQIRERVPTQDQAEPVQGIDEGSRRHRELSLLLWILLLLILIYLFGFLIAPPAFTFLYLRWRSGESWKLSIAMAVGIGGLLYGVFILALRVRLYEGYLSSWGGF